MTDLALAIAHHILVFSLAGLLATEYALVRTDITRSGLARLARVDSFYGAVSMAVILVGIGRVVFGVRGWEYYVYYPVFWFKMAAFLAIGLLSILPTMRILAWRRASDGRVDIPEAEIRRVRRLLQAELAVLALVLVFAAAMARGVGY